jgi:hypothetical protein
MSEENERREFLKAAGAAALGGIAMTTVAATGASAQDNMAMKTMPRGKPALRLHVPHDVTLDRTLLAIRRGIGPYGCLGCGFLGVDIIISVDPPPENVEVG